MPFWAMIVWAPPPVMVTPVMLRSARLNDGRVLLEVADRAAGHGEGASAVVVDDHADAALDAADQRLAAGRGAARIGIADAGDVDVEQAARRIAVEDAVEIGLAGAAALVDGVAAAVAVDVDIVDDDVVAVVDGQHGVDLAVARRARGLDQVGRRLDRDLARRRRRGSSDCRCRRRRPARHRCRPRPGWCRRRWRRRPPPGWWRSRPSRRAGCSGPAPSSTISTSVSVSVPSLDVDRPAGAVGRVGRAGADDRGVGAGAAVERRSGAAGQASCPHRRTACRIGPAVERIGAVPADQLSSPAPPVRLSSPQRPNRMSLPPPPSSVAVGDGQVGRCWRRYSRRPRCR